MNFLNSINQITDKQVVAGGIKRKRARAGACMLRFRDYIELGVEAPKTEGWKPSRKVRLTFELLHPDHMITGTSADGTPFSFPDTVHVYTQVGGPTSRFGKLFNKMNYRGDKVHFAQMVGEGFFGTLHHNGDYNNLSNADGEWTIGAPEYLDPMTNQITKIDIPPMDGKPTVFLYENPNMTDKDIQEMWDSIYIDGTKEDGSSKNWIQEAIMESIDWDESRTKSIVMDGTADIGAQFDAAQAHGAVANNPDLTDPLAALGIK